MIWKATNENNLPAGRKDSSSVGIYCRLKSDMDDLLRMTTTGNKVPASGRGSGKTENLRFSDVEFTHTGPQGAAVEPEDFRRAVFSADLPLGLFKCLYNIVPLNFFQGFLACV
jgi:hypothetical protein